MAYTKEIKIEHKTEDITIINNTWYKATVYKGSFEHCMKCEIETRLGLRPSEMWDKVCLNMKCSNTERSDKKTVYYRKISNGS